MARLIRTEKEVEGRYEEVWLVVEEDALEQWPAGAARRSSAGRRPRIDGLRARPRRGGLHRRPAPARDAAHGRAALAARAARVAPHRPRAGARAAGRARGGRPGRRSDAARRRAAATRAPPSRPSAPTRTRRRAPRSRDRRRVGACCEPLLDPDEAVARGAAGRRRAARARARRLRAAASPRRTSSSRASTAPQVVLHNSMETHQAVVQWVGDTLEVYISTQYIWGVRDAVAERARRCRPTSVRVVCDYMGGGFGSKNGAGRLHVHRGRAREAHRPARPLRAHAARGERRGRQPQRDDPAARRSAPAPTAR